MASAPDRLEQVKRRERACSLGRSMMAQSNGAAHGGCVVGALPRSVVQVIANKLHPVACSTESHLRASAPFRDSSRSAQPRTAGRTAPDTLSML